MSPTPPTLKITKITSWLDLNYFKKCLNNVNLFNPILILPFIPITTYFIMSISHIYVLIECVLFGWDICENWLTNEHLVCNFLGLSFCRLCSDRNIWFTYVYYKQPTNIFCKHSHECLSLLINWHRISIGETFAIC